MVSNPAATILQCEAGHQCQEHVSPWCPPVRIQRHGSEFAPSRGGFEHRESGPQHHWHWAPLDRIRSGQGLLHHDYDIFTMHINHNLMISVSTDRYSSTPIARLWPGAHPTRSRAESTPKACGAEVDISRSVTNSATNTYIFELIIGGTDARAFAAQLARAIIARRLACRGHPSFQPLGTL